MLAVRNVTKRFGGLIAVCEASFTVAPGSITGLIGPNGAGKTTLFAIVSGFEKPTSGQVRFAGEDITTLPAHRRAERGIARTFQIVQSFAGLTVRENIAVGAYLRHRARADALVRAEAVAERVGLAASLDQPAGSLTVAGRKRLELARALATEPRLLLLDEVLAGLNPSEIRDMIPVVRSIRDEGVTILMIEHQMDMIARLCDHVIVLAEGRRLAEGSFEDLAGDPLVQEAYMGRRR